MRKNTLIKKITSVVMTINKDSAIISKECGRGQGITSADLKNFPRCLTFRVFYVVNH